MKKFLLAGAAIAALATGAQAADLGSPRAPVAAAVMAPAFSWTCFYLGAHAGFGWASARYTDFTAGGLGTGSTTANGLFGGIQAGYNWQINNFVFGVEGDLSIGGLRRTYALTAAESYRASVPFLSSLRARAGIAADRALFYVTGGLGVVTFQDRIFTTATNATLLSSSTTRAGYTLGAGIEYAFTRTGPPRPSTSTTASAIAGTPSPRTTAPAPTSTPSRSAELPVLDRPVGCRRSLLISAGPTGPLTERAAFGRPFFVVGTAALVRRRRRLRPPLLNVAPGPRHPLSRPWPHEAPTTGRAAQAWDRGCVEPSIPRTVGASEDAPPHRCGDGQGPSALQASWMARRRSAAALGISP